MRLTKELLTLLDKLMNSHDLVQRPRTENRLEKLRKLLRLIRGFADG